MATTQELEIMQLIANAGESKTKAFAALQAVQTQDFAKARSLLAEAKAIDVAAHNAQTAMICREFDPNQTPEPAGSVIVDVATFQNPRERSEVNQRQVGSGPILTHLTAPWHLIARCNNL